MVVLTTRRQRRSRRLGLTLSEAVGDSAYRQRLRLGLDRARDFAGRNGYAWSSFYRAFRLDNFLENFAQVGYQLGHTRQEMVESVLACQEAFRAKGRLPRTWAALQQWRLLEPSTSRLPMPEPVLQGCVMLALSYAAARGRVATR